MRQYLDLVKHVLENGELKEDRTGTGTKSVFGYQMRFNLSDGFPMVTTKKLHLKSIIYELLWFLNGDTNIKYLKDNGVNELDRSSKLILINGDNKIIWIVGMRLDKRFSVKKDSVKLLNIEYLK